LAEEFYFTQFPETRLSVAGSLLASYLSGSGVLAGRRCLAKDLSMGRFKCFYFLTRFKKPTVFAENQQNQLVPVFGKRSVLTDFDRFSMKIVGFGVPSNFLNPASSWYSLAPSTSLFDNRM
jgi:hypothetical protein